MRMPVISTLEDTCHHRAEGLVGFSKGPSCLLPPLRHRAVSRAVLWGQWLVVRGPRCAEGGQDAS